MNYKKIILLSALTLFVSCSSTPKKTDEIVYHKPVFKETAQEKTMEKEYLELGIDKEILPQPIKAREVVREKTVNGTKFIEVYDPLEPLNRRIYYFNYYLDKFILIPAVNTYEFLVPDVAQKGVSNFFSNLQEISTFLNSLLQFKGKKATISLARFAINSTFGILGVFDVASAMELPKTYEDFGLTMAKYGVGDGAYLVLPGFGPSNLRDATGLGLGTLTLAEVNPYNDPVGVNVNNWGVAGLSGINKRKEQKSFRYYGTGSPFEYEYVRFIYTKYRETLVNKGRGE